MQMQERNFVLKKVLCMALIVAMALFSAGCQGKKEAESSAAVTEEAATALEESTAEAEESSASAEEPSESGASSEKTVLGEGSVTFDFTVVDLDGKETSFEIHTDKETVGEALLELDLIAGEDSEYGLFVNTVNGITVDYDKDGVYWAFYVNGEYALSGVDSTPVAEGDLYSLRIE